jgi:hypothetical protein
VRVVAIGRPKAPRRTSMVGDMLPIVQTLPRSKDPQYLSPGIILHLHKNSERDEPLDLAILELPANFEIDSELPRITPSWINFVIVSHLGSYK